MTPTRRRDTRRDTRRRRIARLLTEAFAPVVLIFALLITVAVGSASNPAEGVALGILAAFFAGGLPYAVLLLGIRRGRLGDRHLSLRHERPAMMAIGLASVATGMGVLAWLDAPRELLALIAAMVTGVAVALAITSFWKISIHTACAAGTVAALAVVYGPLWWVTLPIVAAIGWARLILKDHTVSQVAAGAGVGAGIAYGVMSAVL